jgi:hypothetical protein
MGDPRDFFSAEGRLLLEQLDDVVADHRSVPLTTTR